MGKVELPVILHKDGTVAWATTGRHVHLVTSSKRDMEWVTWIRVELLSSQDQKHWKIQWITQRGDDLPVWVERQQGWYEEQIMKVVEEFKK